VSVYFAPNVVSGFAVLDGQQAYDHIGPRRHKRMRPCDRSDNLLPHIEAMARHSTDLGVTEVTVSMPYEALAYWRLFTSPRGTAASCGGQVSAGWRDSSS
jgi:hypothetical protein